MAREGPLRDTVILLFFKLCVFEHFPKHNVGELWHPSPKGAMFWNLLRVPRSTTALSCGFIYFYVYVFCYLLCFYPVLDFVVEKVLPVHLNGFFLSAFHPSLDYIYF